MRKYFKNKKMVTLTVSVLVTTLILTGTFAWSITQFSTTGGLGEEYHYLVKLLDEDSDPLFVNNNWKSGTLDKKVYATSSYNVADIKKRYDEIKNDKPDSIFRDTWVRIKLEETFMRNGTTSTTTITEMLEDTLKSSINDGKYFSFDTIENTEIILLSEWAGDHGRFWILDTESGWLYWAQPLLATTVVDGSNPELEDQTTDHIIDEVSLIKQPSGVWEYTIKATLEAMDVELDGYNNEGAWSDIDKDHLIYDLIIEPLAVDEINFPDETFRIWIRNNVVGAGDGFLTQAEINKIISLDIRNQGISNLTGIKYFRNLVSLDVSGNYLRTLDVTNLAKLNEATFKYNPQYHNSAKIEMIFESDTVTKDIKVWRIDEDRYDKDLNVLINQYNFPDDAFRHYLFNDIGDELDDYSPIYASDGKLSPEEIAKITMINVTGMEMTNLKGIEHFASLMHLYANSMPNLTSIDLSCNKEIVKVGALGNANFTSINVSSNIDMFFLSVRDNPKLKKLDLSNNVNLEYLYAHRSMLTELKLGNHPLMRDMRVNSNLLKSLNIQGLKPEFIEKLDTTYFATEAQYTDESKKTKLTRTKLVDKLIWQ